MALCTIHVIMWEVGYFFTHSVAKAPRVCFNFL